MFIYFKLLVFVPLEHPPFMKFLVVIFADMLVSILHKLASQEGVVLGMFLVLGDFYWNDLVKY